MDYFKPVYYNTVLTMRERRDIFVNSNGAIALPSAEYCTRENLHLWKGLSRKDFMAQFGNAELEKYEVLSAEDMAELEKFEKWGEFAQNFNLEDVEDEEVNNTVGGTNVDAMELVE